MSNSYAPGTHPDLPPPPGTVGAVAWVQQNLFGSWVNSALTLGSAAILVALIPPLLDWAFFSAVFEGESRAACRDASGACWAVISARWDQFFYGLYPSAQTWRLNLAFAGLVLAAGDDEDGGGSRASVADAPVIDDLGFTGLESKGLTECVVFQYLVQGGQRISSAGIHFDTRTEQQHVSFEAAQPKHVRQSVDRG